MKWVNLLFAFSIFLFSKSGFAYPPCDLHGPPLTPNERTILLQELARQDSGAYTIPPSMRMPYVMNALKLSGLTESEYSAIAAYQGMLYVGIEQLLRGGPFNDGDYLYKLYCDTAKEMVSGLKKLKSYQGTVFRGVNGTRFFEMQKGNSIISSTGFMSTSTDVNVALEFAVGGSYDWPINTPIVIQEYKVHQNCFDLSAFYKLQATIHPQFFHYSRANRLVYRETEQEVLCLPNEQFEIAPICNALLNEVKDLHAESDLAVWDKMTKVNIKRFADQPIHWIGATQK